MPDISKIDPSDSQALQQVDALLAKEGIRRDKNLDYTCGIYDDDLNLIATGSCFQNTLRCFAVDSRHQGEGLLNTVLTHLIELQHARGNLQFFLYTKCQSAKFFGDLGFYEVARVPGELSFMENRRHGFADYLAGLAAESPAFITGLRIASIVMNANPFTLGHQYLVEKAAAENDLVHLFIVSEDASLVPFRIREQLVKAGTAHLDNVICHASGSYIISSATFPSYFQKDDAAVSRGHALLDLAIFRQIAARLGITRRYVGEEPFSAVTGLYNQIMQESLPAADIACIVVPRREENGRIISASAVRQAIKENDAATLQTMLPQSSLDFLQSEAAAKLRQKIRETEDVIHH